MFVAGVELVAAPVEARMGAVEADGRRTELLGRTGDQHAASGTKITKSNKTSHTN